MSFRFANNQSINLKYKQIGEFSLYKYCILRLYFTGNGVIVINCMHRYCKHGNARLSIRSPPPPTGLIPHSDQFLGQTYRRKNIGAISAARKNVFLLSVL